MQTGEQRWPASSSRDRPTTQLGCLPPGLASDQSGLAADEESPTPHSARQPLRRRGLACFRINPVSSFPCIPTSGILDGKEAGERRGRTPASAGLGQLADPHGAGREPSSSSAQLFPTHQEPQSQGGVGPESASKHLPDTCPAEGRGSRRWCTSLPRHSVWPAKPSSVYGTRWRRAGCAHNAGRGMLVQASPTRADRSSQARHDPRAAALLRPTPHRGRRRRSRGRRT